MNNPVANLQRTAAEYRQKDAKDKRRYWIDLVLNNALYILMLIFVIYTRKVIWIRYKCLGDKSAYPKCMQFLVTG